MVYTERAQRRQQFHVATAKQRCKYTTSVDIQKLLGKATFTHSESHMTRAQYVCWAAENSAVNVSSTVSDRCDQPIRMCKGDTPFYLIFHTPTQNHLLSIIDEPIT